MHSPEKKLLWFGTSCKPVFTVILEHATASKLDSGKCFPGWNIITQRTNASRIYTRICIMDVRSFLVLFFSETRCSKQRCNHFKFNENLEKVYI